MKPNIYAIISRCVEEGFDVGWRRSHKHTYSPDEARVRMEIHDAIMNETCAYFNFEEDGDE